jgi:alkaline phosphatase
MKHIFIYSLMLLLSYSCDTTQTKKLSVDSREEASDESPFNIILLIGDGMGLTQISAGMYSQGNTTALEKFKVVGLHKPHASNQLVTDSAAAATAFACGVKTYNGAIGVDADTVAKETILEMAEKKGLSTGLVASSTIVHATPASFFAHNKYRKNYEEIATDIVDSGVDFFVGGGKSFFVSREDERNLYAELTTNGYVISDFFQRDFDQVVIDPTKKFGYLSSNKDPIPVAQGRDYLIPASKEAIKYMDTQNNPNGFFLMIEGSQIDWGGHANEPDYVTSEFHEFDKIIDAAYEYARKDGNTLVIVTADHETGGLAIQPDSKMDSLSYAFTSDYHTGTMIPVFAYGPGAEKFGGIYENTAIFNKMLEAYGW